LNKIAVIFLVFRVLGPQDTIPRKRKTTTGKVILR